MKRNHFKLLLIGITMIILAIVNIFVSGMTLFTESNLFFILFNTFILGAILFFMGLEKNRSAFSKDVLQIVFIYVVLYLITIYLLGLFFGFVMNPYDLAMMSIITNMGPLVIIVILQELIRYSYASKARDNYKLLLFITLIFILFDTTLAYRQFQFDTAMEVYEFIGMIFIPSIFRNFLLTYIATKVGFKAPVMYRILFLIPIYIVPIWPNLGLYLRSVLEVLFPIILFLKLNTFISSFQPTPRDRRVTKLRKALLLIPSATIVIVIFVLTSGLFRVSGMAVLTNSMYPTFGRGDMIIVERLSTEEIYNLEVGEVLVYEYRNRILTHRIVEINYHENRRIFTTKGDNNEDVDTWGVDRDIIQGKVSFTVPLVGYPAVWLSELWN